MLERKWAGDSIKKKVKERYKCRNKERGCKVKWKGIKTAGGILRFFSISGVYNTWK